MRERERKRAKERKSEQVRSTHCSGFVYFVHISTCT